MSQLRVYCLGGAGINIGHLASKRANNPVLRNAEYIGLDTSSANVPLDGNFEVDYLENGRGSGKNRETNKEEIPEYVSQMMTRHKPGDFNIVIFGSSSSGGRLGPYVLRHLLQNDHPVVCALVIDTSSLIELKNTVSTFKSIDGQRRTLGKSVVLTNVDNGSGETRGAINDKMVKQLDLISLFLTDHHEEADYEDIRNFLNPNYLFDIEPLILDASVIVDFDKLKKDNKDAVAVMSLYNNLHDIQKYENTHLNLVTGVFKPSTVKPANLGTEPVHLILNTGDFYQGLVEKADKLEARNIDTTVNLANKTKVIKGSPSNRSSKHLQADLNDDGMAD